jgi:hypothetical protein
VRRYRNHSWSGTDGKSSAASGVGEGGELIVALSAFSDQGSWIVRPSMPPATVTTWPVT